MKPGMRRCLACRKIAPREEFWRIVRLYPCHQVVLDQGMGRSVYLCPQSHCLAVARKKNRLAKALKAEVPEAVYNELMHRLH